MTRPSNSAPVPPDTRTLFDRYREAGLGAHVSELLKDRLKEQKRKRRTIVKRTTALVLLLGVLAYAIPTYRDTDSITVPVGTQSKLTLADGSSLELNASAAVRTDFRYGRRMVHLDHGEAFFSVAHDANHPFLVETPAGTVRVTGTQFNVRVSTGDQAAVTLVEGHVQAHVEGSPEVALEPSQQLVLGSSQPVALSPTELDRTLAWRDGKIVLDGVTLGEAAARFAEFHGCTIDVQPSIASRKLGGTYTLKNLTRFLSDLKALGSVEVLTDQNHGYRIISR